MSDVSLAAAFLPGYRIQRELGAGGMATVYLAHDVRHGRDVAIKVLRRDLAAIVGADRFIAEIRTTAHLRHPHILPLFDSGTVDGLPYYVMPFIDGASLRRVLQQGPLPVREAVAILRELADALAYAHAAGIVHRDVKPDNVLLSGRHVFLADFGVARVVAAHTEADQTVSGTSVMVGTPAYMAPEQVAAGVVDHRCDIYAFGILAYELLTGRPPFEGTREEVVTSQLTTPPVPVAALRPDTPAPLANAVMRCLEKKPELRWPSIDALLPVLDGLAVDDGAAGSTSRHRRRPGAWILATVGLALALIASYFTVFKREHTAATSLTVGKLTRVTFDPGLDIDPAISPDGRMIAYAAGIPGSMRIFVRPLAGGQKAALVDEGVASAQRWPQWSPDGQRILFQAGRTRLATHASEAGVLFVAPAAGGTARRMTANAPDDIAWSPAWSPDDRRIAFAGPAGLYVEGTGNGDRPELVARDRDVHSPAWSPDGRRLAFVSRGFFFTFGEVNMGNLSTSTILIVDVDSRKVTPLTSGDWLDVNPVWMPDGQSLLFVSNRAGGRDVFRQRLTAADEPEGEPERVTSGANAHGISLSRDGRLLAYSSFVQRANVWSIPIPTRTPVSVRDARQVTFGAEKIEKLAVSWDGRWLAYDSDRDGQANIWKMPLPSGRLEQVTHGPNNKFVNDWSPDGEEIVYHTMRDGGQRDVMVVAADGSRTEIVTASPAEEQHSTWGPDGNSIIYDASTSQDSGNQMHITRRAKRGAPWQPATRLSTDASFDPRWSPDGRLIAYTLNGELRVIAPDGTGQRIVVPRAAGRPQARFAVWSRDSRTIYYKAYDDELASSIWSVAVDGGEPTLLVTFDDPSRVSLRREFASDGTRFYFTIAQNDSDIWTIELIER